MELNGRLVGARSIDSTLQRAQPPCSGQERRGGDLPVEGRPPPAGNRGAAVGAGAGRGEPVRPNQIPVALDQQRRAVDGSGCFPDPRPARECFPRRRSEARLPWRWRPPSSASPAWCFPDRSCGNPCGTRSRATGCRATPTAMNAVSRRSSSRIVVEPGNQQRHDLEPDAHLVQAADREQDRFEPSAELPVVPVVEALEIDLVEIDPRPDDTAARARCRCRSTQSRSSTRAARACLEDRHRPLAGDERLVVSGDDDSGAEPPRIRDDAPAATRRQGATPHRDRAAPAR